MSMTLGRVSMRSLLIRKGSRLSESRIISCSFRFLLSHGGSSPPVAMVLHSRKIVQLFIIFMF